VERVVHQLVGDSVAEGDEGVVDCWKESVSLQLPDRPKVLLAL
jgi:hypothetical protein